MKNNFHLPPKYVIYCFYVTAVGLGIFYFDLYFTDKNQDEHRVFIYKK